MAAFNQTIDLHFGSQLARATIQVFDAPDTPINESSLVLVFAQLAAQLILAGADLGGLNASVVNGSIGNASSLDDIAAFNRVLNTSHVNATIDTHADCNSGARVNYAMGQLAYSVVLNLVVWLYNLQEVMPRFRTNQGACDAKAGQLIAKFMLWLLDLFVVIYGAMMCWPKGSFDWQVTTWTVTSFLRLLLLFIDLVKTVQAYDKWQAEANTGLPVPVQGQQQPRDWWNWIKGLRLYVPNLPLLTPIEPAGQHAQDADGEATSGLGASGPGSGGDGNDTDLQPDFNNEEPHRHADTQDQPEDSTGTTTGTQLSVPRLTVAVRHREPSGDTDNAEH